MTQKDVDKMVTGMMQSMDKALGDLRKLVEKQKIAEEQQRLAQIQMEMEKEKRRKEDEERKRKDDEEQRKL